MGGMKIPIKIWQQHMKGMRVEFSVQGHDRYSGGYRQRRMVTHTIYGTNQAGANQ